MPRKTAAATLATFATAIPLLLLAASCAHGGGEADHGATAAAPTQRPAEATSRPPSTQELAQRPHWVQSKDLQGVMQQIAGLRGAVPSEQLPAHAESPATSEASLAFETAAALGDALADTAVKIPAAAHSRQMSEADRNAFVSVAQTLRDQSMEFRDAARARQVERMQSLLDNMNASCIACHSRFRDFSGTMDFRKADASPTRDRAPLVRRD